MKQSKELINFNAPTALKDAFDGMCSAKGFTRTYALVHIMHKFIIEMQAELEKQDQDIAKANELITKRQKIIGFKDFISQVDESAADHDDDLPLGYVSDGEPEHIF